MITAEQLLAGMPRCPDAAGWADALNAAMEKFRITKKIDYVQAFLAQVAYESSELTSLEENLNYTAPRLAVVWPKRFPTIEIAQKYAGRPQALAEYVYGGRMGNRPEGSGDGWNYRGQGPIMITGASNYSRMSRLIGDPLLLECPARVKTKITGALVAAAFWRENPRLTILAERRPGDNDAADFDAISRIVNGGEEGLVKRRAYYATFGEVLGVTRNAA